MVQRTAFAGSTARRRVLSLVVATSVTCLLLGVLPASPASERRGRRIVGATVKRFGHSSRLLLVEKDNGDIFRTRVARRAREVRIVRLHRGGVFLEIGILTGIHADSPQRIGRVLRSLRRGSRILSLRASDGKVRSIRFVMGWGSSDEPPPPDGSPGIGADAAPDPEPCTGVPVSPASDLAQKIDSNPAGTTFCLDPGVYRVGEMLEPKAGDSFVGPWSVLTGAVVISSWEVSGESWVTKGRFEQSALAGKCIRGVTTCRFNEDLFMDGTRLTRVLSEADVGPGEYFFDYANDRIYLGSDPTGHEIHLATAEAAFGGTADNVTLSGLTVKYFANPAGVTGAIAGRGGKGWKVVGVTSIYNHGRGITVGPRAQVMYNTFDHNGQMGLGGTPHNGSIKANQVSNNNELSFNPEWEAGGIKMGAVFNAHVDGNLVADNIGSGIWCDMNCRKVVIENNTVHNSSTQGIFYEISYDGVIRNNVVMDSGYGKLNQGLYGANILVSSSGSSSGSKAGVVVSGNTVAGGTNGIAVIQGNRSKWPAPHGPHIVKDVYVHHNQITMETGATGGADATGTKLFISRNNRFDYNTYYLGDLEGAHFRWMNGPRDKDEWRALGQDPNGSFSPID